MESAVLEMAWTAERKETMMVCKDGTVEAFAVKREGGSGALWAREVKLGRVRVIARDCIPR